MTPCSEYGRCSQGLPSLNLWRIHWKRLCEEFIIPLISFHLKNQNVTWKASGIRVFPHKGLEEIVWDSILKCSRLNQNDRTQKRSWFKLILKKVTTTKQNVLVTFHLQFTLTVVQILGLGNPEGSLRRKQQMKMANTKRITKTMPAILRRPRKTKVVKIHWMVFNFQQHVIDTTN